MSNDTNTLIVKDWTRERCKACNIHTKRLTFEQVFRTLDLTPQLEGWSPGDPIGFPKDPSNTTYTTYTSEISRTRKFKSYGLVRTFVKLVADLCELHNHHADITFGHDYAKVVFTTHAIKAVSENDLVMAAQVNAIDMDWFEQALLGLSRTK